ncbi:membrane protein [Dictyobacter arantiisoli]|uniref:Membrane protein n=1 Tax=Dictyobacter arantiisoli TaxID=2014874 RepID=A0A5A5TL83_9CHLR|nr:membrane protein [Dictyobacter arantiisoli]
MVGAAQSIWATTDPARYQCYALTFWLGSQATHLLPSTQCQFLIIKQVYSAFQMLPQEYPPLTLTVFSLPLFLPLTWYQATFAFIMAALVLYTYFVIRREGLKGSAETYIFYMVVGGCALVTVRYDLLPAVLTLLSVIAARKRRWTTAYIALAFGVLLKIYPLLLAPVLFIAEQQSQQGMQCPTDGRISRTPQQLWRTLQSCFRWQWRNGLLFSAIIIAVTALFALADFQNAVVSQLYYFLKRPIQSESLAASLFWVAHLGGLSWQIVYDYGSVNIYTSISSIVSPLMTVLFVFGVIAIFWLQWQRRLDMTQTVIALTLLFITTGKVFSPQYLIWLIPLLAYSGAFNRFWLIIWGTISLLTTLIYAIFYSQIIDSQHIKIPAGFFAVSSLRNFLLAYLLLAYLFNWHQARRCTREKRSMFIP